MRGIILAAGYATRLFPLTENFPKPLLEVGGQTIIDRLLVQFLNLQLVQTHVVTNSRYRGHFESWRPGPVDLLANASTTPDNRLGAVADLNHVLRARQIEEDVVVAAADNLFDDNLQALVDFALDRDATCVCVWRNPDRVDARQRGNVRFDAQLQVRAFKEKPADPESDWSAAPLYYLHRRDLEQVSEYLENGGNPDAPGHLFEWLVSQTSVYAYRMAHQPVDIGTIEALTAARIRFDQANSSK